MTEFTILGICILVTALLSTAMALGVLAYGMKCGKAMQGDIPKMIEPKPDNREENVVGNPFD